MNDYLKDIIPQRGERFIYNNEFKEFNKELSEEEFRKIFNYHNRDSPNYFCIDFGDKEFNDPNKRLESLERMKTALQKSIELNGPTVVVQVITKQIIKTKKKSVKMFDKAIKKAKKELKQKKLDIEQ